MEVERRAPSSPLCVSSISSTYRLSVFATLVNS